MKCFWFLITIYIFMNFKMLLKLKELKKSIFKNKTKVSL